MGQILHIFFVFYIGKQLCFPKTLKKSIAMKTNTINNHIVHVENMILKIVRCD